MIALARPVSNIVKKIQYADLFGTLSNTVHYNVLFTTLVLKTPTALIFTANCSLIFTANYFKVIGITILNCNAITSCSETLLDYLPCIDYEVFGKKPSIDSLMLKSYS